LTGILVRLAVNIIAVFVATHIVRDVKFDDWVGLALFAVVLGLLNAVVKPILTALALPVVLLTLGLAILLINAVVFALAAVIVPGFHVANFLSALLASLVVSIVSWVLSVVLPG
jgi:putative membrane protein